MEKRITTDDEEKTTTELHGETRSKKHPDLRETPELAAGKPNSVVNKTGGIMLYEDITGKIIQSAMEVHSALGPGLLESAYKECLFYKLKTNGLFVEKEKQLPLVFENVALDCGYRIDLLVENKIVIELKSVKKFDDIHMAQIITYLKLGKFKVGLLINFNVVSLKDGIKRVMN